MDGDEALHRQDVGRTAIADSGAVERLGLPVGDTRPSKAQARIERLRGHLDVRRPSRKDAATSARAIMALYDAEGAWAYEVAKLVVGEVSAATRAVESAFVELASSLELSRRAPTMRRAMVLAALNRALGAESEHPRDSLATGSTHQGRHLGGLSRGERQALAYCGPGKVTVSVAANILGKDVATIHRELGHALRHLANT